MIVVIMGVSGSGKTTVGTLLADTLGWPFIEGDTYHPAENIAKMSQGGPLTDSDRIPWLNRLHVVIQKYDQQGLSAIVACSALKQSYRERLSSGMHGIRFVYLHGSRELISNRIHQRTGHFMPATLLDSQLDMLEEPTDQTFIVDIDSSPDTIVAKIVNTLAC